MPDDSRAVPVGRLLRATFAVAFVVASCATDGDDGDVLGRRVPSTSAERSSSTSSPSTTATPTTTTESTSTTVPVVGLVLDPGGLGVVAFGTDATTVVAELGARLGPPNDDRPLGSCPSGEVDRLVEFAELSVLVATTGGVDRFVAWELGLPSGELPRLATVEGISVGSSLTTLRSAYGEDIEVSEDDPFGPTFEIAVEPPGRLGGTLTGTSGSDTVATLSGGAATCGEQGEQGSARSAAALSGPGRRPIATVRPLRRLCPGSRAAGLATAAGPGASSRGRATKA